MKMKQLNIIAILILSITIMLTIASCNHAVKIDDLAANETAYVYKNRTTGDLMYCSNEYEHAPAEPRDFIPMGTASVSPSIIRLCELA